MSKKNDKNKKTIVEMEMLLNERHEDLQNWADALSKKDQILQETDADLGKWQEDLQNWNNTLSKREQEIEVVVNILNKKEQKLDETGNALNKRETKLDNFKNVLIVFSFIALLFTVCSFIFFHNLKSTLSTDDSMDSAISADNNDLESQYYDLLCSIYSVKGYSYFDENDNTFYLDLDCTEGNEISNPEFASYKSNWMEDSNGNRVSVYFLKDGRLAYIPSNKIVDMYTDY